MQSESEMKREPVSAFVVCLNEEKQIRDCLQSLSFCDEVVLIDAFSTDRTVEIAQELGARVIQREWPGFREQKAFGLSSVSHEWVINLDADERLSDQLRENILEVLREDYHRSDSESDDPVVGYFLNRLVFYLGRWWTNGGWYPEYRLRFFRKSKVTWGGIDPHEKAIPHGRTERLKGDILHYTYEDLDDQIRRLHKYAGISAEQDFKRRRKPTARQLFFNPIVRFFKFYVLKRGYREGSAGLIVAILEGYYTFLKYAKLWELYSVEKSGMGKASEPSATELKRAAQ